MWQEVGEGLNQIQTEQMSKQQAIQKMWRKKRVRVVCKCTFWLTDISHVRDWKGSTERKRERGVVCSHTILSLSGTSVWLREWSRPGFCDPALMEVLKVMLLCSEGLLPTLNTHTLTHPDLTHSCTRKHSSTFTSPDGKNWLQTYRVLTPSDNHFPVTYYGRIIFF